ncbi:hypothetical protein PFICI_12258 [Pestalotiopsis fici W106-1]|uniref:LysM domain-containing protein n=1 Tax=Pestalotiopsis fici (strain W106-1 / CGMCC3.15140) TaxID=1229662 RepID=W3WNF3_PESFW|nr:uncharacterized protein PFICI_12258 [Pestalotiopsis fici W106-1]ETS75314.1 hypothetical protein PFICI_12258 [Pestalotiopsis fici W106-1]
MPSLIRSLAWAYLACGCVSTAWSSDRPRDSHERRQDGPVAPGTATDCTWYDTAYDSSFTCGFFEKSWGLTHAEFVDYNPSVKNDCSGIIIGNSYCVEVNFGLPRPTTRSTTPTSTKTSTTTGSTPTTTGPAKPSPTQDGLIGTCTKFYFAASGDTCIKIVEAQRSVFTLADFVSWNPAVKSDCSGLWANTYYCIGVPGTPTAGTSTRPATTTTTTVTKSTPARPSPTQDGIAANCQRYHLASSGDTCQKLVNQYGTFTLDQFYAWNPAVGKSCSGFWLGNIRHTNVANEKTDHSNHYNHSATSRHVQPSCTNSHSTEANLWV